MEKNRELHYATKEEIKAFQELQLKKTLNYLQDKSPFYKRMFREHNIDIASIQHIEDLQAIPLTSKHDLQESPDDFLCCPKSEIIDFVTTSGTLGDPVTFGLTENDLQRLAYNESSSFSMVGLSKNDIIQLMTTIDRRFMAGLAYFMGARELGCGIVRVGNGIPEFQWDTINRIKPTVCMVVPSFLTKLIEYAEKNSIDYHNSSLKKAICIGEALRKSSGEFTKLGLKINEKWPELELFSTYASTEMQSSFTECNIHDGCHIPIDLIIVEILDENGQPVPEGQPGEVTITTIGVEGMPLLRFRTGDICIMDTKPCDCGRNSARLSSVIGRKGQMIKYKGTTLFPPALFDVLDNIQGIENYVIELYTNSLGTDQILVKIGSTNNSLAFEKQIKDAFRSRVRVAPDIVFSPIELIAHQQLPPMSRKIIKFFDLR